jgi:hypothetical protein
MGGYQPCNRQSTKQGVMMLLKNKRRAVYSRAVYGNVIAIIDHDDGKSVTNDAENVIDDLARQGFDLTQYRVIYKDTRGVWDQMLLDRAGHFAGFRYARPGQAAERQEALCKTRAPLTAGVNPSSRRRRKPAGRRR